MKKVIKDIAGFFLICGKLLQLIVHYSFQKNRRHQYN